MKRNAESIFKNYDLSKVPDIENINIDPSLDREERIRQYKEQTPYPDILKVGDYYVKCSYNEGVGSLEDRLDEYFNFLLGKDL